MIQSNPQALGDDYYSSRPVTDKTRRQRQRLMSIFSEYLSNLEDRVFQGFDTRTMFEKISPLPPAR
jgi:hypothetical protein